MQREGLDEVLSKGVPLPAYGELRFGLPSKSRLVKLWGERRPDIVHVVTEGPLGWSAVAGSPQAAAADHQLVSHQFSELFAALRHWPLEDADRSLPAQAAQPHPSHHGAHPQPWCKT